MDQRRWWLTGVMLALAGVLLLTGAGWAQNQGGGQGAGPAGPGSQMCTPGPGGTCVVNPSQTPGSQNCPAYGAGKSQKRKGMKGSQGGAQSTPSESNPPAAGQ